MHDQVIEDHLGQQRERERRRRNNAIHARRRQHERYPNWVGAHISTPNRAIYLRKPKTHIVLHCPSGRRLDLINKEGPYKLFWEAYKENLEPVHDIMFRMNVFKMAGVYNLCPFCESKYAMFYLGSKESGPDLLPQLIIHLVFIWKCNIIIDYIRIT